MYINPYMLLIFMFSYFYPTFIVQKKLGISMTIKCVELLYFIY